MDGDSLEFSISGGDQITASLSGSDVTFGAPADYNGSETFSVSVSDGALTDLQTITVTVNAVNDAPVTTTVVAGATNHDKILFFSLSAADVDGVA